jgi:hypothetical protein
LENRRAKNQENERVEGQVNKRRSKATMNYKAKSPGKKFDTEVPTINIFLHTAIIVHAAQTQ